MQTSLAGTLRGTRLGDEAAAVVGKCVHCGFCLATCPTYRLLGDELDSPRGRIYLVKQVLEGRTPTARTQTHLDRCLTCRACETTCPSGVEYHKLLETGRALVDAHVPRRRADRLRRWTLQAVLPRRRLFTLLVWLARLLRWLLPASLRRQLTAPSPALPSSGRERRLGRRPGESRDPASSVKTLDPGLRRGDGDSGLRAHDRRVLMLQGCVQPALRPNINAAAARVLARAGIAALEVPAAGCCGALRYHSGGRVGGRADMRRLIDAWWPQVEAGAEAVVATASGCGAHLKDFGRLLRDDAAYAGKAARIAALARDLVEVVEPESARLFEGGARPATFLPVAFQSPCTLQHGQQIRGPVELLLKAAGCELTPVADAHLCCGSAGTYSILEPELAARLRTGKLAALAAGNAAVIATANIGCLTHLAAGTELPVRHWIELLDERLAGTEATPPTAS